MRPPIDGVIAFALTLAGLSAAYALYAGWQIVREKIARRKEHRATAQARRVQSLNTLARMVGADDRRELSARIRRDVEKRRYQVPSTDGLTHRFPSLSQPADRAQSGSHGVKQGGVDDVA